MTEAPRSHRMAAPLISVTQQNGIHLPEAALALDPHAPSLRAFVSHAHTDHIGRHAWIACTDVTRALMEYRFRSRKKYNFTCLAFDEPFVSDGYELRLLPAGHIIGSAMLHLTRLDDGATLLYTGDYKLRDSLSTTTARFMQADTLILETTFGLPRYRFPPREEIVAGVREFVASALNDGCVPVLLGYSLGKAQEILAILAQMPHAPPVMAHPSVIDITNILRAHTIMLPGCKPFAAADAAGHAVVFPPHLVRRGTFDQMGIRARTAMLTGWALDPGAKYRHGVDAVFPLSDHADYDELWQTIDLVKPRRVFTVHGFTREFAADLRRAGHDAIALGRQEQLEFAMA